MKYSLAYLTSDPAAPDLIYGLDDKPPLRQSVFVALQHVLAVFVGIVTPPLIIAKSLNLAAADEAFLVSMALLISGAGTLLQSRRIGPVGSGLLSIQGTSFVFLGPVIGLAKTMMAEGASQRAALGTVFGTCLAAALIPILISPFIRLASKIITPLVTGVVVTLIGLTLVEVGITSLGGGFDARAGGSFGSLQNLAWAGIVIGIIVVLNSSRFEGLRMISVVAGLAGGYVVAAVAGRVGFSQLHSLPWFTPPMPFHYGLGIRLTALIPFGFLYLITAIESIGDLTATSVLTNQPITGPLYFKRLRGGVMADGVSSLLAALFNSFPSTTFAQNNGIIQLTGVGSRYIALFVGGILMLLGLCPVVGGVVQSMPEAVLGGATIIMFGTVAVSGIKILSGVTMDRRASTVAAISLGLGLGVTFAPDVMQGMPPLVKETFSSGIATGGICALVLNALLPGRTSVTTKSFV
jgi:xanthine permease XanP